MDSNLPLLLREKYDLVHVPSIRKCRNWLDECREKIRIGLPVEAAGTSAARSVFPYEASERNVARGSSVPVLLAAGETDRSS